MYRSKKNGQKASAESKRRKQAQKASAESKRRKQAQKASAESKRRKQKYIIVSLGLLLLCLILLAGCRPSSALTRLMNAMEALNPSTEETHTEEEEAEDTSGEDVDPLDEERDDAKIEEMDILIGQLLQNMDEAEAEEAVRSLYQDLAESHEWGTQQYNPEDLNSVNESGALALYIGDHNIRLESGRTNGTGNILTGTGVNATEGVASSSGTLQSSRVPITPDNELTPDADEGDTVEAPDENESAGSGNNNNSPKQGVDPTELEQTSPSDPGGDDGDDGDGGDGGGGEDQGEEPEPSEEPDVTWTTDASGHNIVATGQAAITVCMLGGADRLLATSPDFGANDLAQRAFNSSGEMHYTTLWNNLSTDDGSEPMTSTDFNALLDLLDSLPAGSTTLVVEVSGYNTFSTAQLRTLSERGDVGYYALGNMYSVSSMKTVTKNLAGRMDESEDGHPAMDISDAYGSFVDSVVDEASNCSFNVRETIFIDDWDENVLTEFAVKAYVEGGYDDGGYLSYWMPTGEYVNVAKGAAVIRIGQYFHPMTSCLAIANVFDWSAAPHTRSKTQNELMRTDYGYGDGYIDGSDWWFEYIPGTGEALFETKPGDYCYVTPIYDRLDGTTTYDYSSSRFRSYAEDGISFNNGRDGIGVIKDSFYDTYGRYYWPTGLSCGYICLGYSDNVSTWSTVVVKNQYIGEQLSKNSAWQTNSSTGGVYKTGTDTAGRTITYYCTPWSLNAASSYVYDMSYNSSIGGDYDIVVNPTGVGDWTGQSPEAILETAWAGKYLHQGYDDHPYQFNAEERRIKNFYKTFYGLDLDLPENQDILPTILAGPEN